MYNKLPYYDCLLVINLAFLKYGINNLLFLLKTINKQLSQNAGVERKVCGHEEEQLG